MDLKSLQLLTKLHGMLDSSHSGERENAWSKIKQILHAHGRRWNDLLDLLHPMATNARSTTRGARDDGQSSAQQSGPPPLERLKNTLAAYIYLPEHAYIAIALWIAHTHVYQQFMVSPRLVLASPVRRCGKTTALDLNAALCHQGERFDHVSAPFVYRAVDKEMLTLLCDEVDLHQLHRNLLLRVVFNSGYRHGGCFGRASRGGGARYSSYSPMGIAVIGSSALPLTVLDRSIVLQMSRADRAQRRRLRRFDILDEAISRELEAIHTDLSGWSRGAVLNRNPELPRELHDRAADNWRPLVAIADAGGHDWGKRAREAAVALSAGLQHEDPGVTLLGDIRQVLDARGVDRIFSKDLVTELVAMEGAPWSEWRGKDGKGQPRPLTQHNLAQVLEDFEIAPRTIWPVPRTPQSRSRKGYYRVQFEAAWRAYCPSEDRSVHGLRVLRSA